jgi:NAD(P)-dependent dehydrogenase (short-subunit alcohol dehydrogenase family)
LARRGARISLVGLEPDLLAQNIETLGPDHMWVEADVTDQSAVDHAISTTAQKFGALDVMIANAGIVNVGTVHTADPELFARTIEVNLTGVYRTIFAAVPHLISSRGYLLIVASIASFAPMPGAAAYGASKAGVESLAATLRLELTGEGVDVGSIHPSWVDTDLVRGPESALPAFAKMRGEAPWPANTTTSVEACATAFADAVEHRAMRAYVPRHASVLAGVRPLLFSGVGRRAVAGKVGSDLRQLDRENEALGATWH